MRSKINGFTLMELMIVVVIVGILSAIGIGVVTDTTDDAKTQIAKVSTSSIHLAQQEYKSNNGDYYYTSGGCSSKSTTQIIDNLFDGNKDLSEKEFNYCISGNLSAQTFKITAKSLVNNCEVYRDEKNEVTDNGNC